MADGEARLGVLGELDVPLGLGLLRLCTGDRAGHARPDDLEAITLIRFALDNGIRLLDTADVYANDETDLHYGEHLVRNALAGWNRPAGGSRPADEVRVVTKVGMARPDGRWVPDGRPERIRESVAGSLAALGVDRLFLLLLHVRDPSVPFDDTLAALADLQTAGLVLHLGLANTSVEEIEQASRHFEVAVVQNELSLLERRAETTGLLAWTGDRGIPFLAHRPLGGHAKVDHLAGDPTLVALGQRHAATPPEIALAALLEAGEHVLPIVGATRLASVRSSLRALDLELDVSDRTAIGMRFGVGWAVPTTAPAPASTDGSRWAQPTLRHDPGDAPEVVLLMGIQGAGKSDLVRSYVERGYARLNRDELGGTLDGLVPRLNQHVLAGQRRIVLDNTYPTMQARAPVIAAGRMHGLPVRCRHLRTPIHEARINVVLRMVAKYGTPLGPEELKTYGKQDPNLPPPQALERWISTYEPPSLAEGFSSVEELPFVRRLDPSHTTKGLLLDADGTLRRTKSGEIYPRHPDDVVLMPHRKQVLAEWVAAGYRLFIVSNQSGIASGQVTHMAVQACLFRTAELLELPITEITYCPHPYKPVGCFCRKPLPGLGVYLMQKHRLDPAHLLMVGDRDPDAGFATSLGIPYEHESTFFGPHGRRPE